MEAIVRKLKPFSDNVADLYGDAVVLLCGSTAVGENMPWSDTDVIVVANFKKPFLERLRDLVMLDAEGLGLELLGYTPGEFMQMLDSLNPGAIEAVKFGLPILAGSFLPRMREKLTELERLGLTKTECTYLLAK